MRTVTIRDVPEDMNTFLKSDAAAHGRSLNKHVILALDMYRCSRMSRVKTDLVQEQKVAPTRAQPS